MGFGHRDVLTTEFMGEAVELIASNDRLQDRIESLSKERHVLRELVTASNPDDVFWDVGACLGIHTFILAQHLPEGAVVGFEPMPVNRGVLLDNLSVNELPNVAIERTALADESGEVEFAIRESFDAGFGRHSFDTGDYDKLKTIDVPTASGDALAGDDLPRPNVVKIDVEGAEPLVLEGMQDVLSRPSCREVILELHPPNPVQPSYEDYGYTREDVIGLLESAGFTVDTIARDYHLHATKTESALDLDGAALDVSIVAGDIADMAADAIVNSAGTSLRMGTGVAGSLRATGGEELNRAAIRQGPIEAGEAVVTPAFDLDAEIVVHAASMPHYGDGQSTPETIRRAVTEALSLADEEGAESILLPAVGCGLGGTPLATGVEVIGRVLASFSPESLSEVRFVAYTADERAVFEEVLAHR